MPVGEVGVVCTERRSVKQWLMVGEEEEEEESSFQPFESFIREILQH